MALPVLACSAACLPACLAACRLVVSFVWSVVVVGFCCLVVSGSSGRCLSSAGPVLACLVLSLCCLSCLAWRLACRFRGGAIRSFDSQQLGGPTGFTHGLMGALGGRKTFEPGYFRFARRTHGGFILGAWPVCCQPVKAESLEITKPLGGDSGV